MGLREISRTAEEQNALINRFTLIPIAYEPASLDNAEKFRSLAEVRDRVLNLATMLDIDVADSREKSLALTHLEEFLMWAGKAIFS